MLGLLLGTEAAEAVKAGLEGAAFGEVLALQVTLTSSCHKLPNQ